MCPFPVAMRDRWKNRAEPSAGQGTVYWHVLMSRYPEARAAAAAAQQVLRGFDGFHLTPIEWLHMTTLVAGSTEEIPHEQLGDLLDAARVALRDVAAPRVTIGKVLYHPEAVVLAAEPADELRAIQRAIRAATTSVTSDPIEDSASNRWVPHVTIGYSTTGQPAEPIITALGTSVPERCFVVDAISLIVQWGPEREWDWQQIGAVDLRDPSHGHDG
jgi:2''-5'' RNA ligase